MAVERPDHLLALDVPPASTENRGELEWLAHAIQAVTGDTVELA